MTNIIYKDKKKIDWDKIRPSVWHIRYYKEDEDQTEIKFYETSDNFDHSHFCEYVDNEDLVEIDDPRPEGEDQ